jgi:hypothetical protein
MRNKELLNRIDKITSPIVREEFYKAYKAMSNEERQKWAEREEGFEVALQYSLDFRAKAIAAHIRENIEEFHRKYLSDAQMKELNPLIRNAIYTFLKDEYDGRYMDISAVCRYNLPSYWEDCEYIEKNKMDFEEYSKKLEYEFEKSTT